MPALRLRQLLRRTSWFGRVHPGYEREAPRSWPERPVLSGAELEALGRPAPGVQFRVPALHLLTPYRFDVSAKHLYARHRAKGVQCDFALRVYAEHLKVWNGLHEIEPVKNGLAEYLESFHLLLDSFGSQGFDETRSVVPLGRSLSPINGGHRIAAALLHGQDVACRVLDEGLETHNHNYLYFRNREVHVAGGLAQDYQDAIALEYCRLKPRTYAVLLFPSAVARHADVLDVLLEHGHIAYQKDVVLGPAGRLNLIRCVYAGEAWLGTEANGYNGANAKASLCFAGPGPLRFFIFESHDPQAVTRAKAAIRSLFGIDKSSVHINDRHEETIRVAEAILNRNSIHFLDHARPEPAGKLLGHLAQLRAWLREHRLPAEDVCIGGSAVLAAYGIREGKDLDFVHHFGLPNAGLPADLGSHNEYIGLYSRSVDSLVYDPGNHFYFAGLKFASLPCVARLKKARGERKDKVDLSLMRPAL